ncbi:hypothetical protein [Lysobacter sp. Root983]|uniref:hypothetical protein n=1 Tax=Lysobacter sp. Root983 TaxID=1736613 RepID=UPI0012FAF5A5|nr:hypothetical protein [Lysobacter sp. Root983]
MFSVFRKTSESKAVDRTPRGVLPTFMTDELVVLSKASPTIRNTYEIRLALYMAVSRGLRFILAVRPHAAVDPTIVSLLHEHAAKIEVVQLEDFCVYFGHDSPSGEKDGWVLGDATAFSALKSTIQSAWLLERLNVGHEFSGAELGDLVVALRNECISALNVDGENVGQALMQLVAAAHKEGGSVFIQ